MVVSVELRGKYQRRIWKGPADQVAATETISGEALVAFCLMSTHLHLVLELASMEAVDRHIGTIVRRLDATAEERDVARIDVPHVEVLGDDNAVLRYVAYAHANPVKARMVNDPLSWPFSSHRDVYGLRQASWFSPQRILSRLSDRRNAAWLHRKAEGIAPPPTLDAPLQREWPEEGLALIERAVMSVFGLTREQLAAPRRGAAARSCLANVARIEGWRPPEIADFMGWTDRHARRFAGEDTALVRATLAVLRDSRLRPSGRGWWEVPADARGPNLWSEWRESRPEVRPIGHDRVK